MRPNCECGKRAGWWYAPIVYQKMNYYQYLANHAYCEEHADTDNWGEYMYIGFHKKDWRWLKKKGIEKSLIVHNERMKLPSWTASHVKEDGVRWYLGMYGGYHGFGSCLCLKDVVKATTEYKDVIIEERKV